LPKDPNELGALWSKQSARGEYLTGKIGDQEVVCFRNDKATVENRQPLWRVLKSQPKGERATVPATAPSDDIPF
jgi:hypothetical protein